MGGTTCYAATEAKSVIYHARNPSELSEHPDREEIQVSVGKEIALIEQDIGVEVTPAEAREITEKGIRILQCKMVEYLSHTYQVGVFCAFIVY